MTIGDRSPRPSSPLAFTTPNDAPRRIQGNVRRALPQGGVLSVILLRRPVGGSPLNPAPHRAREDLPGGRSSQSTHARGPGSRPHAARRRVDTAVSRRSNRWIEGGLLDTLADEGIGCIAFSPLAQGLLTSAVPQRRAGRIPSDAERRLRPVLARRGHRRSVPRGPRPHLHAPAPDAGPGGHRLGSASTRVVTSALLGASSVEQLDQNLDALDRVDFGADELAAIDEFAVDRGSTSGNSPGSPADVAVAQLAPLEVGVSASRRPRGQGGENTVKTTGCRPGPTLGRWPPPHHLRRRTPTR